MTSEHICDVNESLFNHVVKQYYPTDVPSNLWTKQRETEVIELLNQTNLAIELGRQPSRSDLYFCSLYEILSVDGVERVILKKPRRDGSVRVMVPREEYYDTISLYHSKLGHVGLDRLHFAVRQRFVVPKRIISIFVNCCNDCSDVKPCVENLYSLQSDLNDRSSHLQVCVDDSTDVSSQCSRTHQVPQPPPTQKQPALQQPQSQPQKIMPPQQVQAPKPIAPKPPQATQPVSPLQPLPPPPEVCLRWNSYHSNMQATFPSLLNNEQFVDVTLACEGRSIKCHKMMLSACSAYFEELLSQNPCQHPIVLMKDLRYWEVQALVDFMYRGEVNVGQDKLPSLLAAAEALQIKGLAGPAFSSNDDDNSQAPAPPSTSEEYLDESIPSPSSARRARKRRVMSSNIPPRVQTSQSQPVQASPKNTSSKRPVKSSIPVPSTSSSYEIESSTLLSEPPTRRQRKTDQDLVGEIKIEPIDIEISNDSMDQMDDSFLEKTYDESGGEESNCISNDPGGTTDSKNLDLGDIKSLHGHETDPMEYGTNNSASGSDHNFKYEDSGSQDASLGPISDMPGTSYQ